MPLVVRLALFLIPKDKWIPLLLIIVLLPFAAILFIVSSFTTVKQIPAISPDQVQIYIKAVQQVEEETGLWADWKELVAIDAVRFQQDFSKATLSQARSLAWRFIEVETIKSEDGKKEKVYSLLSLDKVLQQMVEDEMLKPEEIQMVKDYLLLPWESMFDSPIGLPEGYIPDPEDGFVFPVVGQWQLTDVFRDRINPVTGKQEYHKGVDLAAKIGTPVVAAKKGKVMLARANGSAGNEVRIQHEDGMITRYLHMHSIMARKDQEVEAGQLIGLVGTTGQSTGPHLHFEIHLYDKPVDPAPYIFRRK
ncbi:M23 family metallopeptidase [Brevibacillus massiliensis]|uniref:M23 family metallopeptidase n=1 Tax=Brevibacillus massiliensis TaxID=1118054 RepID=UPI000316AF1D|nr:M23 family metallopeptidase [Brevibacillus massiliensis]